MSYSISEISKLTGVTARALRHYEERGLLQVLRRSQSGYRYYDKSTIDLIEKIKKFKAMDFSLDEIREILNLESNELASFMKEQLIKKSKFLEDEIQKLNQSKQEIQTQLMATNNFFEGKVLEKNQRRVLMEVLKTEVLEKLKLKREVRNQDLAYLKREEYLIDTKDKRDFISAVKECIEFANKEGIKIGTTRGTSPALLSFYALGISDFDPVEHELIPERFASTDLSLHLDVEFKNGKKFIDFCKRKSAQLEVGRIEAFKLPILDIINNVHERLGKAPDYDSISFDDPIILDQFRKGEIDYIFSFDIPKNTLLAKHIDNHYYKDGSVITMFKEYLKSQEIKDFKDLLNIESIFRPDNLDKNPFMQEYMDRYPRAKKEGYYYDCLSSSINEYLKPNYGVIIYQEDIIHIIKEYTGWDYVKCNSFRQGLRDGTLTQSERKELLLETNDEIFKLLEVESSVSFCKAHSVGAWPKLIKKTAILKTLHKDVYLDEINKWEMENSYSWGDFGFITGEVSLFQQ